MLSFLPDSQDTAPEILRQVAGVPTDRGFAAYPLSIDLGYDTLSANSQGGALLTKLDGTSRTLIGTATAIFELSGTSWSDRTRGSGAYNIGTNRWRFQIFGDTSLAINLSTVLQSGTTGVFADVGNAPKAACMESVAGFIMLANTDDSTLGISGGPNAAQQHRWWCSQIFAPTSTWAPDVSTQATTGLLVETPGAIRALKRLSNDCVAYKDSSIYVGRYVGPPAVWQWQCVSTDVGCAAQGAVISVGTTHFFIGEADIYAFDGTRPVPIGAGVREWFFSRLNRSQKTATLGLHDQATRRVFWFYCSGTSTTPDSVLVYHYPSQRFGHYSLTVQSVLNALSSAVTYANIAGTYATLPVVSYDDPYWSTSSPLLAYIGSDKKMYSISGTGTALTLRTGQYGQEDGVSLISRVRPKYRLRATSATLTPWLKDALGDTPSLGTVATESNARFDVLHEARYQQFDYSGTGDIELEALVPTIKVVSEE